MQDADGSSYPLYIEMVGPSGVGKTTIAKLIAEALYPRPVFFRGGLRKRQLRNFVNTLWSRWRLKYFFWFYRYLRVEKRVPRAPAARRAAAITGIPACPSFARVRDGVLLVEEGPLMYFTGCGGYGPHWEEWVRILLPDDRRVRSFFVVLRASPEEIRKRRNMRGRIRKRRSWPKGTEGMTDDLQEQARCYWLPRLSKEGAYCIEIGTDDRSASEVAQEIVGHIRLRSRRR